MRLILSVVLALGYAVCMVQIHRRVNAFANVAAQ
jgi:hypothetical protein